MPAQARLHCGRGRVAALPPLLPSPRIVLAASRPHTRHPLPRIAFKDITWEKAAKVPLETRTPAMRSAWWSDVRATRQPLPAPASSVFRPGWVCECGGIPRAADALPCPTTVRNTYYGSPPASASARALSLEQQARLIDAVLFNGVVRCSGGGGGDGAAAVTRAPCRSYWPRRQSSRSRVRSGHASARTRSAASALSWPGRGQAASTHVPASSDGRNILCPMQSCELRAGPRQ